MNKSIKLGHYFLKSVLFGTKFPMALSVDVTNKCNLRCKHCYFFQQNHKNELSEEDLLKKVKEIKKNILLLFMLHGSAANLFLEKML